MESDANTSIIVSACCCPGLTATWEETFAVPLVATRRRLRAEISTDALAGVSVVGKKYRFLPVNSARTASLLAWDTRLWTTTPGS